MVGRLEVALQKTEQGEPRGLNLAAAYDASSSLAHRKDSRQAG